MATDTKKYTTKLKTLIDPLSLEFCAGLKMPNCKVQIPTVTAQNI